MKEEIGKNTEKRRMKTTRPEKSLEKYPVQEQRNRYD